MLKSEAGQRGHYPTPLGKASERFGRGRRGTLKSKKIAILVRKKEIMQKKERSDLQIGSYRNLRGLILYDI